MRVWIDLANSPHVAMFEPIVTRLRERGDDVTLTVRDHAQTLDLARQAFGDGALHVVGRESPRNRLAKGTSIARRARALFSHSRALRPDVALSHGSYAHLIAARAARIPAVTMMDYEYQPANHLSFRLANLVVVPESFPQDALRRCGARERKVVRYPGFKEELYLGRFVADGAVLRELDLDPGQVIVVMRPPPEGALYHRMGNDHFERVLDEAARRNDLQIVVLPRFREQAARYVGRPGVIVPQLPVEGRSLLAHADLMIGAGGTMNREAALLGTPTYTVFAGRLAAVDRALIARGILHDLRTEQTGPVFEKKPPPGASTHSTEHSDAIMSCVIAALDLALGRQATHDPQQIASKRRRSAGFWR